MKKLPFLLLLVTFFACNEGIEQNTKIQDMENQLADAQAKLAAAEAAESRQPGLAHSVFFWLKKDLNKTDEAAFLQGVNSLKSINTVLSCFIGPPASTEARDVVDNTFSYALLVYFENVDGQNAYQTDPIHLKFVEDHKDKWTKVVVYDSVVLK